MEEIKECVQHPEKKQIFILEKLLSEANIPFWFNYRDDISPTPFGNVPDINWDRYCFRIFIGHPAGQFISELSIRFSTGANKELLELFDTREYFGMPGSDKENVASLSDYKHSGKLTKDLTAEEAFKLAKDYYTTR